MVTLHRSLSLADLAPWGQGLHRPECVLATMSGDVFVPDWRGGVSCVDAHGRVGTWLGDGAGDWLRPNGIAVDSRGGFLIANLGDDGGVWHLTREGKVTPFLTEVDGVDIPPANFVITDAWGRTWVSVSTRQFPRQLAWRPDVKDGFVAMVDRHGARLAIDGLHYANEVRLDPSGEYLYVVETFGRRLRRGRVRPDGTVAALETVVDLGQGYFPDGFAFDAEGGIWITSIVSNRLVRFAGDTMQVIVEDVNEDVLQAAEQAYATRTMRSEHLGPVSGGVLQQLTSLSFGGQDKRDVFLGCLHSDHIMRFRSDVPGL